MFWLRNKKKITLSYIEAWPEFANYHRSDALSFNAQGFEDRGILFLVSVYVCVHAGSKL